MKKKSVRISGANLGPLWPMLARATSFRMNSTIASIAPPKPWGALPSRWRFVTCQPAYCMVTITRNAASSMNTTCLVGDTSSAAAIRPTRTATPPHGCRPCGGRSWRRYRALGLASLQELGLPKEQRQQGAEVAERRRERRQALGAQHRERQQRREESGPYDHAAEPARQKLRLRRGHRGSQQRDRGALGQDRRRRADRCGLAAEQGDRHHQHSPQSYEHDVGLPVLPFPLPAPRSLVSLCTW